MAQLIHLAGIPATVTYDGHSPTSFLSSRFIAQNQLTAYKNLCLVSVSVSTTESQFTSILQFSIDYNLQLNHQQNLFLPIAIHSKRVASPIKSIVTIVS